MCEKGAAHKRTLWKERGRIEEELRKREESCEWIWSESPRAAKVAGSDEGEEGFLATQIPLGMTSIIFE